MKVDLSDDRYGVEASKHDVALAQEVKGVAESVRDLATYLAGESRRSCEQCGKTRPCRPVAGQDDTGRAFPMHVCAGCQKRLVEQRIQLAAERAEAEGGDE